MMLWTMPRGQGHRQQRSWPKRSRTYHGKCSKNRFCVWISPKKILMMDYVYAEINYTILCFCIFILRRKPLNYIACAKTVNMQPGVGFACFRNDIDLWTCISTTIFVLISTQCAELSKII